MWGGVWGGAGDWGGVRVHCLVNSWLIFTNGDGIGFGFLYYADFSIRSDLDSNPLIQMYVIGTEICPWDGDLSLKWVQ